METTIHSSNLNSSSKIYELSMNILFGEIKPVIAEKDDFENWEKSLLIEFWYYDRLNEMMKINDFAVDSSSESIQFSIEILIAEIKFLVTEKLEFECRKKSELTAFSGTWYCHEFNAWITTNVQAIKFSSTGVKSLLISL